MGCSNYTQYQILRQDKNQKLQKLNKFIVFSHLEDAKKHIILVKSHKAIYLKQNSTFSVSVFPLE